MTAKTKVYLITGFLGSGKTTFLNRIMAAFPRSCRLMVLMNEFGEVGIDGSLIEGEDFDIMEINKGSIFCVCVKTDFIRGLHRIALQIQPDTLVMESTGVANPTDLGRDLKLPIFKGRFDLKEQFCIVDAVNFEGAYGAFASVEKQIASSTVFIINKIDLATAEQLRTVKAIISRHHGSPRFLEAIHGDVPIDGFFDFTTESAKKEASGLCTISDAELEAEIEQLLSDSKRQMTAPDRLLSAVYVWRGESRESLLDLVDKMPRGLIRVKGFIAIIEGTFLFSYVMGRGELKAASLAHDRTDLVNRLVFIGPPEVIIHLEAFSREYPNWIELVS